MLISDLDQAMQWCEETILKTIWRRQRHLPLAVQLTTIFQDETVAPRFLAYLQHLLLKPDSHLFEQGQAANALYWIESGEVVTYQGARADLHSLDGQRAWMQTLGQGTLVGSVDFISQPHYTTSAWISQPGVGYRLTRDQLAQMETHDPEIALAFFKYLNSLLAQQLARSFSEVQDLLA